MVFYSTERKARREMVLVPVNSPTRENDRTAKRHMIQYSCLARPPKAGKERQRWQRSSHTYILAVAQPTKINIPSK